MGDPRRGGLRAAAGWMVFPILPVVLARAYHETMDFGNDDPRLWDAGQFAMLLGPLIGYGFLVGATRGVPAGPARGRARSLLASRWLWVGVGPWAGYLFWMAVLAGADFLDDRLGPIPGAWPDWEPARWVGEALGWLAFVSLAYGWLPIALAALLRARRVGRLGAALRRGALAAAGFVGSLLGGFWAATEVWRSYFFDPRIAPAVLALAVAATAGGCSPETLGELRRRELFEAMLAAWVLGLALLWRWWSRPRPGEPG